MQAVNANLRFGMTTRTDVIKKIGSGWIAENPYRQTRSDSVFMCTYFFTMQTPAVGGQTLEVPFFSKTTLRQTFIKYETPSTFGVVILASQFLKLIDSGKKSY